MLSQCIYVGLMSKARAAPQTTSQVHGQTVIRYPWVVKTMAQNLILIHDDALLFDVDVRVISYSVQHS